MTELDTLESLLDCRSIEELHASTRRLVNGLGYEHFIYGVQVNTSLTRPYQFVFNGYPDGWRNHYVDVGYQATDPTVVHCIKERRVIPLIWSRDVFSTTEAASRMMNEATEFGLRAGATFSVQGGHGEAAMLSLATPTEAGKAQHDILGTFGKAQLLACYLHESIQRVVLSKEALPLRVPPLTEREKECLLWAAEGKTTWEIAGILTVAERTVVFHLQNATRKMGVTSRQHAVARAVTLGLIAP